jgi:hypothetical protein
MLGTTVRAAGGETATRPGSADLIIVGSLVVHVSVSLLRSAREFTPSPSARVPFTMQLTGPGVASART